jgi:hypothetical protein
MCKQCVVTSILWQKIRFTKLQNLPVVLYGSETWSLTLSEVIQGLENLSQSSDRLRAERPGIRSRYFSLFLSVQTGSETLSPLPMDTIECFSLCEAVGA